MPKSKSDSQFLDSLEGLSLIGAVLGTGAGFVFQQFIYASAPLTLALLMNFVNRQRHQTLLRDALGDRVASTRIDIERQFEDELHRLREEIQVLETAPPPVAETFDVAPLEAQIQDLHHRTEQPIAAVAHLQTQVNHLTARVSALSGGAAVASGVAAGVVAGAISSNGQTNGSNGVASSSKTPIDSVAAFWRQYEAGQREFAGLDLAGADLTQQSHYLYEVDLSNANLEGATLTGLNLGESVLNGVRLNGAQLDYANFSQSSLIGANLENANLRGANLRGANLNRANLKNADLSYADLTHADLDGAELEGAVFFRARTDGTILMKVLV